MFKELAELAKSTTIHLAISSKGNELCVMVMPQAANGEHPALSTPLQLTGTPEELDNEFATVLTSYTGTRKSLEESLAASKLIMNNAAKESATAARKSAEPVKAAPKTDSDGESEDSLENDEESKETTAASASPAPAIPQQAEIELF